MAHPIQRLDDESLQYCMRVLSASALALVVGHKLVSRQPCSVVRMGDGERKLIRVSRGQDRRTGFLSNQEWLVEMGLDGANLSDVGASLLAAGERATCFCPSISGVWHPGYRLFEYFPQRDKYFDAFFPYIWRANDQLTLLVEAAGGVIVLHRHATLVAQRFSEKYQVPVDAFPLDGWRNHKRGLEFTRDSQHPLVLVSGGPAGKYLCVQLAEQTGKVVVDAGRGMLSWCR